MGRVRKAYVREVLSGKTDRENKLEDLGVIMKIILNGR